MKKSKNTKEVSVNDSNSKCEYCGKQFVRASSLSKHSCVSKTRMSTINTPESRIAHLAWQKVMAGFKNKKNTQLDFVKDSHYKAFIEMSKTVCDNKIPDPFAYIDWLLDHKINVDKWSEINYLHRYTIEMLKTEKVLDSVYRSINTIFDISEEMGGILTSEVFKSAPSGVICRKIIQGNISPWVIYNSASGHEFLSRINPLETEAIYDWIDPDWWNLRMKREPQISKTIFDLCQEVPL
jgi:hypothetical protein